MKQIELSAGTIEYQDTGDGPPLVLLHGLMMDASLWDGPIAALSADHRCVAPTLPLGAHRYTLIPLDQPARLAQIIRGFTRASVQPSGHAVEQTVRGPTRPFTPAETEESR